MLLSGITSNIQHRSRKGVVKFWRQSKMSRKTRNVPDVTKGRKVPISQHAGNLMTTINFVMNRTNNQANGAMSCNHRSAGWQKHEEQKKTLKLAKINGSGPDATLSLPVSWNSDSCSYWDMHTSGQSRDRLHWTRTPDKPAERRRPWYHSMDSAHSSLLERRTYWCTKHRHTFTIIYWY